jgi:hypothetical protein
VTNARTTNMSRDSASRGAPASRTGAWGRLSGSTRSGANRSALAVGCAAHGGYVAVHTIGSHAEADARSAPWPAAWSQLLWPPEPMRVADQAQFES